MMHRIKYSSSKSLEGTVFLLKSQKGLIISIPSSSSSSSSSSLVSDVGGGGGGVFSSATPMGGGVRRFFNTGGRRRTTAELLSSSSSSVKRDMFQAGDIPNLFRGRQSGGCVGSFVPHQFNKSHRLPYFARALASSSASQSSGQTPRQEPTEKKKRGCHIISSKLQTERYDELSSTKVSLNQFPGLMAPGMIRNSETRRLLQMNPDTGYFEEQEKDVPAAAANHHGHYDLQVPHRHVCRGSAYGWLFLTDDNLDMKLFNPFSGAEIQLPPVKTLPPWEKDNGKSARLSRWFVFKAVFSANPSVEPRPVVLVIFAGDTPRLAFCKPGDKEWTPLEFPKNTVPMDAIYHKGQFYVLGWLGYIAAFDIGRCVNDDDHSVKRVVVVEKAPKKRRYMRDCYLVVLDGELVRFDLKAGCMCESCFINLYLKGRRKSDGDTTDEDGSFVDYSDDDFLYESIEEKCDDEVHLRWVSDRFPSTIYGIKIRRFDASEKQWVKVESLGGKAVFLGYNTSFALSASDYPAGVCIPDSVYFTFGVGGNSLTEMRFYDTGIYNVKTKTIKRPVKDETRFIKPAPIWIVNSADR